MAEKNRCIRVGESDWSLWTQVAGSKGQSVTRMLKSAVVAYAGLKKPDFVPIQVQSDAYAEPESEISVERYRNGWRVVCGAKEMVVRGKADEPDALRLFGPSDWAEAQKLIRAEEIG